MKKLYLFLFASVLLTLSFTSCIFNDDDIIGKVNIESYILIQKEYDILYPYEEDSNNDYSDFLKFNGYYNSDFKSKVENNNEYKLFYGLSDLYYINKKTQRNFRDDIEFEIIGIINEKEISEIVNFPIKISNLKLGFNCCEFQIETSNFGNIDLLYTYYFEQYSKDVNTKMDSDFYILIPKEQEISAPLEEKTDKDYAYFLAHTGYYGSNFKTKVENNNNEYKLFYSSPKHYYGIDEIKRRKFKENIEFEITEIINEAKTSEIVNFVIEIPYLESGYSCCEFRIRTKKFGIINLLYLYYLR